MTTAVKIVAHSISPQGKELIAFQYTAHRFILAEINTHKMLSKNARSSRAVPTKKLIEEVRTNPAMPIDLASNQAGMVAGVQLDEATRAAAELQWREAARYAADQATRLSALGLHKQWANRVMEPFMWVHGLITGTEWSNFFARRRAPDAQPEFRHLADLMWEALQESKPEHLLPGEWHLPYVLPEERPIFDLKTLQMLSAARVARISYKPFDGDARVEKEMERAQLLINAGHMSPFEHQGTPDDHFGCVPHPNGAMRAHGAVVDVWERPEEHANFNGWRMLRKMIPGENITEAPRC
jgi:thymidylate synthase ThyX